ncbi:dimethylhistidine N-methyltransferase [Variovorax sp. 54]|uniref:L-histidine N(alpha)-methyltransferase n=1 Tax=Variovorax sp. 54 TaxID=2035212 RepID=UPI000C1742B2|nr:L-histidine N(alpha)-methyltransferase [Variovorax sp. 54]PIF73776.1 dimethylhistidine N-methyltransferase [Variovorax sp. 54]
MIDLVESSIVQADAFRLDVFSGLAQPHKTLPSRWLYDDRGCELFEDITRVKEYYPTVTEKAILRERSAEIAEFCGPGVTLIEYGAGAGIKTEIVLDALTRPNGYVPIDIAGEFLLATAQRMAKEFPSLTTWPVVADFTSNFLLPPSLPTGNRVGFFPGSTLGNLDKEQARAFLRRMHQHVGEGGRAIIGIDLIKDLRRLLPAYDDVMGVTAEFNLNYLKRINRELRGTFPVDRFEHEARWNAEDKAVEMHLVSLDSRSVTVGAHAFLFDAGETIHTESSRKYDVPSIRKLATSTGWKLDHVWTDKYSLFAVVGLSAIDL